MTKLEERKYKRFLVSKVLAACACLPLGYANSDALEQLYLEHLLRLVSICAKTGLRKERRQLVEAQNKLHALWYELARSNWHVAMFDDPSRCRYKTQPQPSHIDELSARWFSVQYELASQGEDSIEL